MNYVKGLASLLDVELGEEFILDGRTSLKYRFTREWIC